MLSIAVEGSPEYEAVMKRLAARGSEDLRAVEPAVREIVDAVRSGGDAAVRSAVKRFERRDVQQLVTMDYDGAAALARLPADVRRALELAADRIASYHERQKAAEAGFFDERDGVTLGLRVRPLSRVGVYAPGGKARYPSSVLMTAVVARVAGVSQIVLATPAPDDLLLAAAHLAGVTEVLDAGGAQAIAALAYGTESIARVDKIVGPGNVYVACAKRLVAGDVAIDSIAGPTEVCVAADESADAEIVAADLVSQAEHDEAACSVLVTTSRELADAVVVAVRRQVESLPRRAIAEASLRARGAVLVVSSRDRLAKVADDIGAEHLSLHVVDAGALLDRIEAAGAVFVGSMAPVAAGDYLAGPSHVLPTGGTARFGSPLGVHDFVRRSSVIGYTRDALASHAPAIRALASAEGLEGHARSVDVRLRSGRGV